MSLEPATVDEPGYCEPEDVVMYFDRFNEFTTETNPSRDRVKRMISSAASKIDTYTGHAWRARRITNEMKNLEGPYRWESGLAVKLTRRDIRTPLDADEGDSLQLWRGNEYDDLVTDPQFSEGRNEDYWIEESTGMLHIYRRKAFFNRYRNLKLTYRFGKEKIPADVTEACAKLVAADLMESDFYKYTNPGNEEAPDAERIAEKWREQVWERLKPYKEVRGQGLDMF